MLKSTKVVGTIGPATDTKEKLQQLIDSGLDVARLNFSHGNHEYFQKIINNIRSIDKNIAIMLDTKGPEIRTGALQNKTVELVQGKQVVVTSRDVVGDQNQINVDYQGLDTLKKGDKLLLDDGLIELKVVKEGKNEIIAKIMNSGILEERKRVTIPNHAVKLDFLTKKDKEDILFGAKNNIDMIAASFVRCKEDVEQIRKITKKHAKHVMIISKIEHWESVEKADEIIEASDGIMVARGDLGVEIELDRVPLVQQMLIQKCNEKGKPVIVATQMLESMRHNPRPTRAEVSDVTTAILQGADAIMLSAETASGKYPKRAVSIMTKIAKRYDCKVHNTLEDHVASKSISLFISKAAYIATKALNVKLIVAPTKSGFTAINISRFKPKCPIVAITTTHEVARKLQLSWGVVPVVDTRDDGELHKKIYDQVIEQTKKLKLKPHDKVVVTAGFHSHKGGKTNLLEIYKIKDIMKWF